MKMSPVAPLLWILAVSSLALLLIATLTGFAIVDPIIVIAFYLLCQELSKFIGEMTLGDDDGKNS